MVTKSPLIVAGVGQWETRDQNALDCCCGLRRMSQLCYGCVMVDVASRELRNNTRALLDRVEAGESITITVDGRAVAVLQPVGRRPRWLNREEFVRRMLQHQADARLRADLRELAPDTTDDIRVR